MTLGALALIVAATLAIDAAVEHGPERWAAWQRRREASKLTEAGRFLPSRLGVQVERRRDGCDPAFHRYMSDVRRLHEGKPAPPAAIGRRRD